MPPTLDDPFTRDLAQLIRFYMPFEDAERWNYEASAVSLAFAREAVVTIKAAFDQYVLLKKEAHAHPSDRR